MTIEETRATLNKYFDSAHADSGVLADDVVFTVMATGEEHRGPDAVLGMIRHLYHIAFEADSLLTNMVIGEGKAITEWDFVGKHTGEFAGVLPTNKEVHVPLCVAYDLEDNKITRGRVYFETPAFLAQVGYA
jgi:predicted ester cyclase